MVEQFDDVFEFEGIQFTLENLVTDEDSRLILRNGIAKKLKEQGQQWLTDIEAQKEVYETKIANLVAEIESNEKEISRLEDEKTQLHLDNEDLSEKRDAAVREKEEAQAETNRLYNRVAELEQKLASAPSASVVEITSDEQLKAAAQRLKERQEAAEREKRKEKEANKIRVYNIQAIDTLGATLGAYRADNDEYITFSWIDKNQYVELSTEEVTRFRQEREEANQTPVESVTVVEQVPAPVLEQFQTTPIQEHTVLGQVADEAIRQDEEIQSIVAKLTKRMERVEAQLGITV